MPIVLLSLLLLFGFDPLEAQRTCTRGKPCGNTCINVNYTCRVGNTPPPPPAATPQSSGARPLLGSTGASLPPLPSGTVALFTPGMASYCSTGMESIRDLLLVAGPRPGSMIGRDMTSGGDYRAPTRGDTVPVRLISVHCATPTQVNLFVQAGERLVMLDHRAILLRSPSYDGAVDGNVRVRARDTVVLGYVWLDAFSTGTVRADH